MRWDDLQLLHLIDEFESEQSGQLSSGWQLMQAASQGQTIDWDHDCRTFAHELLLARAAGYLEWTDPFNPGVRVLNPVTEAQQWLQQIYDIRLTLAGRDRARGREIHQPLPDPDEDDDRPITGMTLEEIARAIGDTYTGYQLPRYLRESGIPEQFIPAEVTGSKWEYVLGIFEMLHDGGSAARRALREFIGGWLDGRYHTPPQPEIRKRITALLAAQGWYVARAGSQSASGPPTQSACSHRSARTRVLRRSMPTSEKLPTATSRAATRRSRSSRRSRQSTTASRR